jgi:hypothetical protein
MARSPVLAAAGARNAYINAPRTASVSSFVLLFLERSMSDVRYGPHAMSSDTALLLYFFVKIMLSVI